MQLNSGQTSSENAVKSLHEALQETVLMESNSISLNDQNTSLSGSSPEFSSLKMRKSRLCKTGNLYSRSNSVCTSQIFLTLSEDSDNVMDTQLQPVSKSKSQLRVQNVVSGSAIDVSLIQQQQNGVERGTDGLGAEDAMNVDCEATSDATTQTPEENLIQQSKL